MRTGPFVEEKQRPSSLCHCIINRMDLKVDLVVIGAGIVGLATALEAVRRDRGRRVAVLEKESAIGQHQTGHNSGVIHSGIYYKPGSLKARNCVAGAAAMVEFCRQHNIAFDICGKVVVATAESELPGLQELMRRGTANGVPGLAMIDKNRLREIEPHCAGLAALQVPGTGIADYPGVARKYAELIEGAGGQILTQSLVRRIKRNGHSVVIESERATVEANFAINC